MTKKEKKTEEASENISEARAKRLAFVEKYKASNPVRFERVQSELEAWVNEV